MLDAPRRLGAQSRCWVAPVGSEPSDESAWKSVGWTDATDFIIKAADLKPYTDAIDRVIANMKKASESYSIKQPVRWVTGVDAMELTSDQLKLYYGIDVKPDAWGNWAVTLPGSKSTNNERSRPMGLTKDHKYKDNDGDWIEAESDAIAPSGVLAFIKTSVEGVYVNEKFAIPLALNVLGYDRPGAGDGSSVSADGFFVPGIRIQGDAQRAELAAKAISYLKSVDIYDQSADERKVAEEAKKAHDAKLEADLAVASADLREWSQITSDFGVSAIRAEKLAEAVAKYKVAFYAHAGV